jgi:hypothetical protein
VSKGLAPEFLSERYGIAFQLHLVLIMGFPHHSEDCKAR